MTLCVCGHLQGSHWRQDAFGLKVAGCVGMLKERCKCKGWEEACVL